MGQTKAKKTKEEIKEEANKEEEPQEIVLKVDMHCVACSRKIAKALKGFEGVEAVTVDSKESRVVAKGKTADPIKVSERLRKRIGRRVEIVSPLPKPPEENKEESQEPPKEDKKEQPSAPVTVVLHVRMHCEACAQRLQKRIRKIPGVESVETNLADSQVIVKGVVDPEKLLDDVYRKTKKQVSIVKNEEDKKESENKEAQKIGGDQGKAHEEGVEEDEDTKFDIKRSEFWPSKNFLEYSYTPHIFSDENPNACSVM